jgi:hypothetical protein
MWSWCEETSHLEVRPAVRGEGPVVKIDGGAARSDRDWIYWRLPTVSTREAFGGDRQEASVRVDRGEVRVGVITAETKLGDNWCDASKAGHALFLDTFFGVLRDGDKVVFSSARLKAAIGDVITVRLQQSTLEFCINGATVGHMPVDALRQLRMAVQMWDKGDAVFLIGAERSGSTLGEMSMSLAGSPIKAAADTPLKHLPHGQGAGQGGEEETGGEKGPGGGGGGEGGGGGGEGGGGGSGEWGEGGTVGVADAGGEAGISEQSEGAGPAESVANDDAHTSAMTGGGVDVAGGGSGASDAGSGAGGGATEAPAEAGVEGEGDEEAKAGGGAGEAADGGESAAAPGGDEEGEAEGGGEGEGGAVAVAGEGGEGRAEGEGGRLSAQGEGGGEGDGTEGG